MLKPQMILCCFCDTHKLHNIFGTWGWCFHDGCIFFSPIDLQNPVEEFQDVTFEYRSCCSRDDGTASLQRDEVLAESRIGSFFRIVPSSSSLSWTIFFVVLITPWKSLHTWKMWLSSLRYKLLSAVVIYSSQCVSHCLMMQSRNPSDLLSWGEEVPKLLLTDPSDKYRQLIFWASHK